MPSWPCDELVMWRVDWQPCRRALHVYTRPIGAGARQRWSWNALTGWRQESHNISVSLDISAAFVGHTPDYISDLLTPVADIPTRSSLRASSNGNLFLAQPVIINSKIDEFIIKRYITFNAQAWTSHSCISIRGMSPLSNSIQCHMHATALLFSL